MFQLAILVMCLVSTIAYIFFIAAGDREEGPVDEQDGFTPGMDVDAA